LTARRIAREFQRKEWKEHGSGRRRQKSETLPSDLEDIPDAVAAALDPANRAHPPWWSASRIWTDSCGHTPIT
jgi:hypothetical protein